MDINSIVFPTAVIMVVGFALRLRTGGYAGVSLHALLQVSFRPIVDCFPAALCVRRKVFVATDLAFWSRRRLLKQWGNVAEDYSLWSVD